MNLPTKFSARAYRMDEPADKSHWNLLVRQSKNGSFLFYREYMDYHRDRFADCSLMIYKHNELFALMPATLHGDTVISHGGLTYGGILSDRRMGVADMLDLFPLMLEHYHKLGARKLVYKPIPHVYHLAPAEEDLYALFLNHARLTGRAPSAAIDLSIDTAPGKKFNGAKKAQRLGLTLRRTDEPGPLMQQIDRNLLIRHNVHAVHAVHEIQLLMRTFPSEIEAYEVINGEGILLAGAIIYVTARLAHAQYLVVNETGRSLRAMDLLVTALMEIYRDRCRFFEFGISSDALGDHFNAGLMDQKESFNASTVCYDRYELNL